MGVRDWHLVNLEERASHVSVQRLPSRSVRECVAAGQYVKLVFQVDRPPANESKAGEALPVLVTGRRREGNGRVWYAGTVQAEPILSGMPKFGDLVAFDPEHILGVFDKAAAIARPADAAQR